MAPVILPRIPVTQFKFTELLFPSKKYRVTQILKLLLNVYFICGIMDVISGTLKGIGYAIAPMIISLTFICGFRFFWVYAVFPSMKTPQGLLLSYPVSWTIASIMMGIALIYASIKLKKERKAREALEESTKTEENNETVNA